LKDAVISFVKLTKLKERNYDVIVIGVGSMGSAVCYHLAQNGAKVLGIEQFHSPHEHGSHTGQTRIIRKAYFEHPGYVPLLERAYENWHRIEELTGSRLYFKTGLLYIGQPGHSVIKGVKHASSLCGIAINETDGNAFSYPQFKIHKDQTAILEQDAGFLLPEKTVNTYIELAIQQGAAIHSNEVVLDWEKKDGSIQVKTNKTFYSCARLVITAGAWMKKMAKDISKHLRITRQFLIWVQPSDTEPYSSPHFPCWMIARSNGEGVFYGFPYLNDPTIAGPAGLKFGLHYPGPETDPSHVNRDVTKKEIEAVVDELSDNLPIAKTPVVAVKTCLYSNSPDEDFIIDMLPAYDNDVIIAAGFSGHGFKFVSVIGEILAELAIEGKTKFPLEFLSLRRFTNS
jgi:sarcosine oxidase